MKVKDVKSIKTSGRWVRKSEEGVELSLLINLIFVW